MNRWKRKRKRWLDTHSRKQLTKTFKIHSHVIQSEDVPQRINSDRKTYPDQSVEVKLTVPEYFSLTENSNETMAFFMRFFNELKRKEYKKHFFIDSSLVKHVTVDALIYLLAIMQNYIGNRELKYGFRGNIPIDDQSRRIYQESGFFDYVDSRFKRLPKSTDKMQIISGNKNDPQKAREFCEFVMRTLGKKRTEIFEIQSILIELMSNVYHHAYIEGDYMYRKWYMYAEHIDNIIRFVFVDTGTGIAKTVRLNWGEKIRNTLGVIKDGNLLVSTFRGDFRTGTEEEYRGNGLQNVRIKVMRGPFKRFDVISGHGKCIIDANASNENNLKCVNYKETIFGTLYCFDVC